MSTIYYIIIVAVIIIFLLRNKRRFTGTFTGLPSKQKLTIWFISLVTLVPIFCFIAYILYTVYILNPSDYWYNAAQKKTTYHIYRSSFPPAGKQQTTLFMTSSLAGLSNATRIVYDRNVFAKRDSAASGPIVVNEVGVPEDFNLDMYINTQIVDSTPRKVDISTSQNGTGILLEKNATTSASLAVSQLIFRTQDNVLIQISALRNPDTNLIQTANTLK